MLPYTYVELLIVSLEPEAAAMVPLPLMAKVLLLKSTSPFIVSLAPLFKVREPLSRMACISDASIVASPSNTLVLSEGFTGSSVGSSVGVSVGSAVGLGASVKPDIITGMEGCVCSTPGSCTLPPLSASEASSRAAWAASASASSEASFSCAPFTIPATSRPVADPMRSCRLWSDAISTAAKPGMSAAVSSELAVPVEETLRLSPAVTVRLSSPETTFTVTVPS